MGEVSARTTDGPRTSGRVPEQEWDGAIACASAWRARTKLKLGQPAAGRYALLWLNSQSHSINHQPPTRLWTASLSFSLYGRPYPTALACAQPQRAVPAHSQHLDEKAKNVQNHCNLIGHPDQPDPASTQGGTTAVWLPSSPRAQHRPRLCQLVLGSTVSPSKSGYSAGCSLE